MEPGLLYAAGVLPTNQYTTSMLVQGTIDLESFLDQGLDIGPMLEYRYSMLAQGTINIGPILHQGLDIGPMLEYR